MHWTTWVFPVHTSKENNRSNSSVMKKPELRTISCHISILWIGLPVFSILYITISDSIALHLLHILFLYFWNLFFHGYVQVYVFYEGLNRCRFLWVFHFNYVFTGGHLISYWNCKSSNLTRSFNSTLAQTKMKTLILVCLYCIWPFQPYSEHRLRNLNTISCCNK